MGKGNTIRMGTRGGSVARAQSQSVAERLELLHPGLKVEAVVCSGQRGGGNVDVSAASSCAACAAELEALLLDGRVEFVVHPLEALAVTPPLAEQSKLLIGAFPRRADPRDVLVWTGRSRRAMRRSLLELRDGARVAASGARRRAQVLALRDDLHVESSHGCVETQLRQAREGGFDAAVIPMSGLQRAGLYDASVMEPIDADTLLPAPGQGALAVQCRAYDVPTRQLVGVLDDPTTRTRVELERKVMRALGCTPRSPLAVLATLERGMVRLRAALASHDADAPSIARAEAFAERSDSLQAVHDVLDQLAEQRTARAEAASHAMAG